MLDAPVYRRVREVEPQLDQRGAWRDNDPDAGAIERGIGPRIVLNEIDYDPASFTATLKTQGPLSIGRFQLVVSDDIVDAEDGLALDGELDGIRDSLLPSGDGLPGGDAVIEFDVTSLRRATGRFTPVP